MALEQTFFGYVGTSNDAFLIFEACRGNQLLQKVGRRPHDRERGRLIKSGNIFVFDKQSSDIKRWTDGVAWSPSRILDNFLIYRQIDRPLQSGEKKRKQKRRGRMPRNGSQGELDDSNRMTTELSDDRSPSPRAAGGPIRGHKKIKTDSSSNSENGSAQHRNHGPMNRRRNSSDL
jgi:Gti1/Pac2 family transcription factor